MATTGVDVVLTIEYVDADLGLWCTDCALSTGVRVWFTVTPSSVGATATLRSSKVCIECGGKRVADED